MPLQERTDWFSASNYGSLINEGFTKSNRFIGSGVAERDSMLQALLNPSDPSQGGFTRTLPIGVHYDVPDTVMGSSASDATGTERDSFIQTIALHARQFTYTERRLKRFESGVDPMGDATMMARTNYMANIQSIMVSTLKGIEAGFATGTDSDLVISTASTALTFNVIADAHADFGDIYFGDQMVLVMRTQTYDDLVKLDGAAASQGAGWPSGVAGFASYQGLRVIIYDNVPANTTYVLKPGFFSMGTVFAAEDWKNPLARQGEGQDYLINRHWTYMVPKGFSYTGDVGDSTPTNANLEVGTNWRGVYSSKKLVGVRVIKHS